jgi:integrase
MLADIVRDVERQVAGIIDPSTVHLKARIDDSIKDYRRHLEAKGRSEVHIGETVRLIRKVLNECECKVLGELHSAGDALEEYLADRHDSGVSHRTVNADLVAVRSFCRWLLRKKRIHNDPTVGMERLNVEEDRRLERRALTEDEALRLIKTTMKSKKVYCRLTGGDRAVMYMVAQRTGLRRKELRRLTPKAFNFDVEPGTVTVKAADAKGRKSDVLPLAKDIAATVRKYVKGRDPNNPVWPGSWWRRSAEMMRLDLRAAGIKPVDSEGRVVDFHGQRTTFITSLARAGVTPAKAQRLARHSDINLTMGTYTQLGVEDLQSAVDDLPVLNPTHGCDKMSSDHANGSDEAHDLSQVTEAWPDLSDHIKRAILALVSSAKTEDS